MLGSAWLIFGFERFVDFVLFWPMMLVVKLFGSFAAPVDIGPPDAPVYEATPIHLFIAAIGFVLCLLYWGGVFLAMAVYRLWPWLQPNDSERRAVLPLER